MHTDRYLDYNSNNPILAELSVIHTLTHRAEEGCSTPELLAKEMDHFTMFYKSITIHHSRFNKLDPNRKPTDTQTHLQENS